MSLDHLGRWVVVQTTLYPTSGIAVTRIGLWRWSWARVRPLTAAERAS